MSNLVFTLLVLLTALSVRADSLRFIRVSGGPPLPGVSDAKSDIGAIRGDDFKRIKAHVQTVLAALQAHERWIPKEAALWDVGPDAGYVSAIIELDGKTYTLNSWFPIHSRSSTIAVSERQGLVSVRSKKEKQSVESRNSTGYRQIVAIFDHLPEP